MIAFILLHVIALTLTILIELSVALITGYRDRKTLKVVVLAQIVTNPIVVLISNLCILYTALPVWAFHAPLEIAALCAEWMIYRKFTSEIHRPFLFSLAANASSYIIGVVLSYLGVFNRIWFMLL
ncbi:MAG: hypothetical protein II767_03870 [Proteobacteria bacterium]|nr:hypothetical protein [Pseudomonadota bacterium]MBQ4359371.1 hypothetical protein [Pseudomonadota bacterium]